MSFHKTYESARAAHKPMKRSRMTIATGKMRSARRRINQLGPRGLEWKAVWRFLKPRLQAAGRTRCEFDWPDVAHECWGPLDPAHSKKRHEMQEGDIYAVAISCREFHNYLDQVCSHSRMEELVLEAINRHGGMILPKGSV